MQNKFQELAIKFIHIVIHPIDNFFFILEVDGDHTAFPGVGLPLFSSIKLKSTAQARNFNVPMDSVFYNNTKSITKSAYYHLKNTAWIKGFLSKYEMEKVHVFISIRLNYINGVFTGFNKNIYTYNKKQLQLIQNATVSPDQYQENGPSHTSPCVWKDWFYTPPKLHLLSMLPACGTNFLHNRGSQ